MARSMTLLISWVDRSIDHGPCVTRAASLCHSDAECLTEGHDRATIGTYQPGKAVYDDSTSEKPPPPPPSQVRGPANGQRGSVQCRTRTAVKALPFKRSQADASSNAAIRFTSVNIYSRRHMHLVFVLAMRSRSASCMRVWEFTGNSHHEKVSILKKLVRPSKPDCTGNQICESWVIQPGCTSSSLATSSFQIFSCNRWPSALLSQLGTQYSLILQPDSSFPWLSSPAVSPCKMVRLPTSAVRAMRARIVSCMILVKVLASRPKPVEQRPGATMFTTTSVCSTGHKAANCRTAHSSTSLLRAYLVL